MSGMDLVAGLGQSVVDDLQDRFLVIYNQYAFHRAVLTSVREGDVTNEDTRIRAATR
jgi:hypothetical protein